MIEIVTPASVEPLTLAEVKAYLGVDDADTAHDDTLESLITAARQFVEYDLNIYISAADVRQHVGQTLSDATVPRLADSEAALALEAFPVQAGTVVVAYEDADGATQTVSSADYQVLEYTDPQRIEWIAYPSGSINDARVEYTVGRDPADVDKLYRLAMLFLLAHWFDRREAVSASQVIERRRPLSYDSLVRKFRKKRPY